MSREERKMAQIIASIERMEQETRASGDDSSRTQEAIESVRQGFRGKKGKKGKNFGVKFKTGKRLKVTAVAGGSRAPFERKLTPKKRWIQLWSAQMDEVKERDTSQDVEMPLITTEDMSSNSPVVASSPVSEVKVAPALPSAPLVIAEKKEKPETYEEPNAASSETSPSVSFQKGKHEPCLMESKLQEPSTEDGPEETLRVTTTLKAIDFSQSMITPKPFCVAASSSLELRVETPSTNGSSHLSPPLERISSAITASISPSAKIKESDTPNTSTAAVAATAAKFSPTATTQEKSVTEKQLLRMDSVRRLESKSSESSVDKESESHRTTSLGRHSVLVRKGSAERIESPTSDEAKQRAERRRKRKSNWDVGDPRKGGSPVADPPISAAAAAANQQSFAKYPSSRPSWRPSQSTMDMKLQLQSGHRSSTFYNNATSSRRGFYTSSSLSQDRSRSAGRSFARHSYVNSSIKYR